MSSVIKQLLGEADAPDTMTVGELIEFLREFPAEMAVYYGHPSHDHWSTELAGSIKGAVQQRVKYSDYHQANQVDGSPDDDEGAEERRDYEVAPGSVLVLTPRRS